MKENKTKKTRVRLRPEQLRPLAGEMSGWTQATKTSLQSPTKAATVPGKENNTIASISSNNKNGRNDPRARVLDRRRTSRRIGAVSGEISQSHSKRSDVIRGRTTRFSRTPTRSRRRRFRWIPERREIFDGELVNWDQENGSIRDAWENEEISNARPRASIDARRCAWFSFPFVCIIESGFSVRRCVTSRSINGRSRSGVENLRTHTA